MLSDSIEQFWGDFVSYVNKTCILSHGLSINDVKSENFISVNLTAFNDVEIDLSLFMSIMIKSVSRMQITLTLLTHNP